MMKRKMQIIIVWGSILFLLGMLVGCGKGEKKFVGKWVHKSNGNVETLELKSDGTYKHVKGDSPGIVPPGTGTGTWEVRKENGEEWISFIPPIDFYIVSLKKKGNILVHPISGKSYVKQD